MSEIVIEINTIEPITLYGESNKKINLIKNAYPGVKITNRGYQIKISGHKHDALEVKNKLEAIIAFIEDHSTITVQQIQDIISDTKATQSLLEPNADGNIIVYGRTGQPIKAKKKNQKKLVDASNDNDIVFAIGPAGTGKTYTAVALAIKALKAKLVKKIILTRPAVEAGESLGFLPGDMKEKVDPYLRPLYDALDDMIPADKLAFFLTNRTVEIAPLAFMRGRTLDNSFIILDEAQNCTSVQLKMFLTRLGPNAKCIITGDLSQIDLPYNQKSGLQRALNLLKPIQGIGQIFLDEEDVVRHRLVKEIIKVYNKSEEIEKMEKINKLKTTDGTENKEKQNKTEKS